MLREPAVPRRSPRVLSLMLPAALVALMAACASIPPPTDLMSRAQEGLKAAEQAGAADADPVDLNFARGKLEQARQALAKGKNGPAGDLAQESLADSRLAQTNARLASMRAQVQAQRKENARLRRQLLDRAAARQQAAASAATPSSVQELPQTVLPEPAAPASAPASPQPARASSSMQEGQP